ncbi:L-threonylcarbamoyladenylate synthase [Snodgrassella alvi]|jgi:L-threonylcarbamoyladenylate synthase|uniref:Threonylcarbamoyl-AMP synthase n=1 Tax=Snodgrassella alvi TaxID=1196083 RepID=A0A855FLU4_9NEIS|nr:L-threonylcarbamoyladenylate synthase [Snodgrassella alvi]PIT58979.1 tRNA threonylcarbamoyladenosine biosynthesis protein RimN [Snodgrassella alvi]
MRHPVRPAGRFLHRLRAHLCRGGLIAYPAEGSYGLGCLPDYAPAIRKVMALKKRPQHKGLIVIAADFVQLQPLLAPLSATEIAAIRQQWPAPKTLLLPVRQRVLPVLRGRGRQTLAVRIPDLATARFLCKAAGTALVSTSCNRAGKKACSTEREVRRQFGRQVMILGGRTGGRNQPSQIVDWVSGKRLR